MRTGQEHPATPRATTRPQVKDLAWAAGFIEGEGTFTTCDRGPRTNLLLKLSVTQVQREPLDRLARYFGGRIRCVDDGRPGCLPRHEWYVTGARARGVTMTLYAWLSPRRRMQVLRGGLRLRVA